MVHSRSGTLSYLANHLDTHPRTCRFNCQQEGGFMAQLQPSFDQIYTALATILDNSEMKQEENGETPRSLRQEASRDGVCYLRVLRHLPHTDLYAALVAATPDLLQARPIPAFFTEEQLSSAVPLPANFADPSHQTKGHAA
jgi:hypothetical protein